jgi:hypothetical protein
MALPRVLFLSVATLAFAVEAAANLTVDLIWVDSGTPTLTLALGPGDSGANGACDGYHFSGAGRCMKIVWTVGPDGLGIGSNSVSWQMASGLSVLHAAFFPSFQAIPVGKSSKFGPFPAASFPTRGIDNGAGVVAGFAGSVPASDAIASNHLPAGTYVVATIVFDTSNVAPGTHTIVTFLTSGLDGFFDSSSQPTPLELRSARLLVPEPGAGVLLAAALLGLAVAGRRPQGGP